MFTRILSTSILAFTLLITVHSAFAFNNRSFVSTKGLDTNPCTPAAPCRLFAAAIDATNAGGEVVVLDSGGFGAPLNITKSITLVAPDGVNAGFVINAGTAVTINTPGIFVRLRGLNFAASGGGASRAIDILDGNLITIENCSFTGFTNKAILLASASVSTKLAIIDSRFIGNVYALWVSSSANMVIDHSKFLNNDGGAIRIEPTVDNSSVYTEITNTLMSGNNIAIYQETGSAVNVTATLDADYLNTSNNGYAGVWIRSLGSSATISNSRSLNNIYDIINENAGTAFISNGNNIAKNFYGTITTGTLGY